MLVGSLVTIVVTLCKIGPVRKPEEGCVGQSEPVTGSNNQSEGFFFFISLVFFFIKKRGDSCLSLGATYVELDR